MEKRLALLIGNSKYKDEKISRLQKSEQDVKGLTEVLRNPNIGGFDDVRVLLNQSHSGIRQRIIRFFKGKHSSDLLLFYFSGHGIKDEYGRLYFAAQDTVYDDVNIQTTAIEAEFIKRQINDSDSKRIVVILDCCYSGAFTESTKEMPGRSVGTQTALGRDDFGWVILTATDTIRYAWEDDRLVGEVENSVFTHYLIHGLKTGKADLDGDGEITPHELYDYVYEQVMSVSSRQKPVLFSHLRGKIILARSQVRSPLKNQVRLQNLRDFTVKIRISGTETIVGTGIAVSRDGQIVTCAHVVEKAVGAHPRQATGKEVDVYFPAARGGKTEVRRATVKACLPQHDDDVVLLRLVDDHSPLEQERIAVLGNAQESAGNAFRAYGYCRRAAYIPGHAHGMIMGDVEPPEGLTVRMDPVQLESEQINRGLSGAAVLDTVRNLVVGLVSEQWFADESVSESTIAWATNTRVLGFDPFRLPVRQKPLPLAEAPRPKTNIAEARKAVAPKLDVEWNDAPAPLLEWVGRKDLLEALSTDWTNPERRVTGLIGFGGEGKSSLARKWVENLRGSATPPEGLFWWGFYGSPNVDEFFEAALRFMSGGKIEPADYPSTNAKAHLIAGMLYKGPYLFVLDGLEVMQHEEGDQYGLLRNDDLRQFLSYVAAPGHRSFCLITSRAPVLDLMDYTTYTHRDVTRLSPADGWALLQKLGVKGDDKALENVVADWGGHALTLSLLGSYLVDQYEGDVRHIGEIPPPTAEETRYERVHRVLKRYDTHLTEAERAFLMIFSAFRPPVGEAALNKVFRAQVDKGTNGQPLHAPIAALDVAAFEAMIKRLVAYRILRYDEQAKHYTTHPLVRSYYLDLLNLSDPVKVQEVHQHIKEYYLSISEEMPENPTLEDLGTLIEAVHHACCSGKYDEAYHTLQEQINQGDTYLLPDVLGVWDTYLAVMLEFFPGGKVSQEPQVSRTEDKSTILHEVGFCMQSLGHLDEAASFYKRSIVIDSDTEYWLGASRNYANLAELYTYTGTLDDSEKAAHEELVLARRAENKEQEIISLSDQAQVANFRGYLETASSLFRQAETLQQEIQPQVRYLYKLEGIKHADYLRRSKDTAYARRVTEKNLEFCERNGWKDYVSQNYRVLGDLDADAGQHDSARAHYDEAIKIARSIARQDVLIEALLSRGRWAARYMQDPLAAFSDLNEALDYTVNSGYRTYEADIRVALAWAYLAEVFNSSSERKKIALEKAELEAARARRMSKKMAYYWGKVDAEEVETRLDEVS